MTYTTAPAEKASALTKHLGNLRHNTPRVVRLTHAEAVAVIETFVYLFGSLMLNECSAIRQVSGWTPARLESFALRDGLLWIAENLPKLDDSHYPSGKLAMLRKEVEALDLEAPMTYLEVEPPPRATIKTRTRQY